MSHVKSVGHNPDALFHKLTMQWLGGIDCKDFYLQTMD